MSDIAISVENLSKSYLVGHNAAKTDRYVSLRDVVANNARNLVRKTRDMIQGRAIVQGDEVEEFWALKDLSFEINRGDRVGIIGRNGAGKSTLLKTLSRITEPTKGRIKIAGRVASLLEVGTGFHPELTGRENIYLNGAILGMTHWEIHRKFDEIVDFAGVERFLDTPVKRYSSGMYVRLAFSVAAHLESEILIVDEVLAVGDAQFQKKCMGKMQEIGKNDRTLLFVSHNIAAITNLCGKGIYLNSGKLHTTGNTNDVVNAYINDQSLNPSARLFERKDRKGTGIAKFHSIKVTSCENIINNTVACGQNVIIHIKLTSDKNCFVLENPLIGIGIDNSIGQRVMHFDNETIGKYFAKFDIGNNQMVIDIPKLPLSPGTYTFSAFLSSDGVIADWVQNAESFIVEPSDFYGTGKLPSADQGCYLIDYSMRVCDSDI
jgi:lipopolysaccharide transport system ATP-binding protein